MQLHCAAKAIIHVQVACTIWSILLKARDPAHQGAAVPLASSLSVRQRFSLLAPRSSVTSGVLIPKTPEHQPTRFVSHPQPISPATGTTVRNKASTPEYEGVLSSPVGSMIRLQACLTGGCGRALR